uniref:ANK_REP_REGION domain-containing protein n=1 Tax=Caenorhabditis japonica TaxID=281687 RepID=A0A8R1HMB2_CAEJA
MHEHLPFCHFYYMSSSYTYDRLYIDQHDAPSEQQVDEWLAVGDVGKLEQIVLDGRGHMLREKKTVNAQSNEFLSGLTQYLTKIDAIHKAVEEGDAGRTPLHYAAADPNGEHMIKVLQKSGGDAFIEDKHGHTPFYYRTHGQRLNVRSMKDNAVMNQLISGQLSRPLLQDLEEDIYDWIQTGNVGKLEELVLTGYADLLLGRNHEVDDSDSIGFLEVLPQYQAKIQSIHKAVETGNLRAVKLLTDRKKLSLCRDSRGLSPLHKAIVFERTDIAKYLIRNYPQSVNAMDQKKRTPLHYAAALKDGGYLYKVMRKSGADPNIYDCNGRPAKYYLKHSGEIDLSAMRLDTRAALKQVLHNRVAPSYLESSIQQWLRDGQLAKLEQLVLSGCGDLLQNRTSSHTDTQAFLDSLPEYTKKIDGIHRAIKEGNLDRVKELMKTKKLAIARDRFGCTPLHSAVVHEHTEIVRYIAGHYNSVLNAPDYNKRTAMHYAAAARDGGHYLKILGKAGADPMAVDNEGRTPDYYRRNAVIDLKLIKDRDEDYETINEEYLEDGPLIDSPATPDSGSEGSFVDSARMLDDEDESVERHRFEKTFRGKIDLPTSENGVYLARTVAPVLTKALAEVLLRRPADPIGFIAEWLTKYVVEVPRRNGNGGH